MTQKQLVITSVYKFTNGMVIVFDQYGQQMPDFQGMAEEAIPKIRDAGFHGEIENRTWRPR